MNYVYHIKKWDANFENYKSRTVESCRWVCMPNKQDGLGLLRILAEPDGSAIFGIWCLILQACSRQRVRDGYLTDDGTPAGRPWDFEDLAFRWRRPLAEIQRCLDFLTSDKIQWVERLEEKHPHGTAEYPAADGKYPPGTLEGMNERMNEGEGTGITPPPLKFESVKAEEKDPEAEMTEKMIKRELKKFIAQNRLASDETAVEEWYGLMLEIGVETIEPMKDCVWHCCKRSEEVNGQRGRYARENVNYARGWAKKFNKTEGTK
jgi:hypothetical protein